MGLFSGPWQSKEEHERGVHLNLISRINSLELIAHELGAKLQVAQGRVEELEKENERLGKQVLETTALWNMAVIRIEELEKAMQIIYDVYLGSKGFTDETAPEGLRRQLIKEMAAIAARHMKKDSEKGE